MDVGCGTGISTRCFATAALGEQLQMRCIGVEPGKDMRQKAQQVCDQFVQKHGNSVSFEFIDAMAENFAALVLPRLQQQQQHAEGHAQIVMAAQAAHWFNRPEFYK